MRSAIGVLLLVVAASGCGSASPAPKPAPRSAAPSLELRFAWRLPAVVGVRHARTREGSTFAVRYVVCARALEGAMTEVREVAHQLERGDDDEQTLTASGVRPVLLIAEDGTVYDVVGMERTLAGASGPESMQAPGQLEALKQKHTETWHLWVDTWLNFDPRKGTRAVDVPLPFNGVELATPHSFEYLGPGSDGAGTIRMRMRSVLEGPEPSRLLAEVMIERHGAGERARFEGLELRRTVLAVIETRPATLEPQRVKTDVVTRVTMPDGEVAEHEQSDEFWFDWHPPAVAREACQRAFAQRP